MPDKRPSDAPKPPLFADVATGRSQIQTPHRPRSHRTSRPAPDEEKGIPVRAPSSEGNAPPPTLLRSARRPAKSLKFELAPQPPLWRRWLKALTEASTEPSDGLGAASSEGSASVTAFLERQKLEREEEGGDGEWQVDQVIVDRDEVVPPDGISAAAGTGTGRRSDRHGTSGTGGVHSDSASINGAMDGSELIRNRPLWYRTWRYVIGFFSMRFEADSDEAEFEKQHWYASKRLLFYSIIFLYINWVLYLILNHSVTLYEKITYYGVLSFFTLPLLPFFLADIPRKHRTFFMVWLTIATWYCGWTEIIQTYECQFYRSFGHNHCFKKDFLMMNFYGSALPMLVMFAWGSRLWNAVAQVIFLVLEFVLIIPYQSIYARNIVSFILFSAFLQYIHYSREYTERHMFLLASQLKAAYRAQQKAQIAESNAVAGKKRFTSYIFHEVRVPLNNALLAFQNLQSEGAFAENDASMEVYALNSSLIMMKQVLGDVLDLQKMDAGRFEITTRPFPLHQSVKSMLEGVKVAAQSKNLDLIIDLDPRIDQLAINEAPEGLYVVGDAVRLQQVLVNICSNAVTFTPSGSVRVVTKLVRGPNDHKAEVAPAGSPINEKGEIEVVVEKPQLSYGRRSLSVGTLSGGGVGEREGAKAGPSDDLIVRFEVHDQGPGIRPSDLNGGKLFTPFVQTYIGRVSGKGSGLGLAIVRQIVSLSNGRLGVQSKKGQGATFWFELAFRRATLEETAAAAPFEVQLRPTPPPFRPVILREPSGFFSNISTQSAVEGQSSGATPGSAGSQLPLLLEVATPAGHDNTTTVPVGGDVAPEPPLYVLVVDDDVLTRNLFSRMLSRLGCQVETAVDGQNALDILLPQPPGIPMMPDLICLDNSMPIMNGEDVVRHLRAAGRNDLVVGCTGNALAEDQASYLAAGADRILTKPLLLRDIKDIVALAKERRKQKQSGQALAALS